MLVASIRSVLDSLHEPEAPRNLVILVYTTQYEIRRCLKFDFGDDVEVKVIRPSSVSHAIDENVFTAIGHERVFAIPALLATGCSVLYLDNDTLVVPGIWKLFTSPGLQPMCYTHESWQTMATWLKRIHKTESVLKAFPTTRANLQKPIVNNGVQFYPVKSPYSRQLADRTQQLYQALDKLCGYSYGFDQVAYSMAVYEIMPNIIACYHQETGCEGVWHAYQTKRNYCWNLKSIGLKCVRGMGSTVNQCFDIYHKLHESSINTGVMNSYNRLKEQTG